MGYGAGHYVIKVSFLQVMGVTKNGWVHRAGWDYGLSWEVGL